MTAPQAKLAMASPTDLARFASVETWVFDLDNTLYPFDNALWPKIDERITLYLANLFGLDGISARALQKYYYRRYGTTLRGLMQEYAISAEEFLRFVHDIDRSSLKPDEALGAAISVLPGRKLIFTNGSREHAIRTARQLGIASMFDDVFDIVAADLVPKPAPQTYARFFDRYGVDPLRAAIFEDIPRNLIEPHNRGMLTTLIVPKQGVIDRRESWERDCADFGHVDFMTSDLQDFLRTVADVLAALPQGH